MAKDTDTFVVIGAYAFARAERRLSREIKGLERAQVEQEIGRLMSGSDSG